MHRYGGLGMLRIQYRRGTRAKPAPAHARAGRYAGAYNNRLATVTADGG